VEDLMAIETATTATLSIAPAAARIDQLAVDLILADPDNGARISRAAGIVKTGYIERVAPDMWLVGSESSPDNAYRVTRGQCNCPDAQRRDARNCKHCWSVRLAVQAERLEAESALDADAPIPYALTDLAYLVLDGEPCALPAQCPRCHAEAAILSHIDHLGAACLSRELFGGDAA
jgi:hypothetical protein